MLCYYGNKISPHITKTPEGFLICHDVPLARLGPMQYRAAELSLPGNPEQIVTVNRYAEDVFAPAAIASFEGKDVTAGHPPENLTAETWAAYARGHVENVRRQEDFLVGDLIIKDSQLANEVQSGAVREVSAGYTAEFLPDGDCLKQTNIRGNHVAVVPRGRAGHDVAIKDAAPSAEKEREKMSKLTEAWLNLFGRAAKEMEGPELQQLSAHAATVLDAEATPAADEVDYKEQKGVDLGSKLDKLLERLAEMEKKLDGLAKPEVKDATPVDEAAIDKKLEALTADSAAVVEAGDAGLASGTVSKDSAVAFLRAMRPAVAAIEDAAVKAAVADAVLQAVQADDKPLQQIMDAVQGKAQAAQTVAARDMNTVCAEQQNAYDALNPHRKN
ncbi:MAG: DUF2213 domain-containing protein [Peptococcaceae bacterium]|jgi:hypothetical protein|nr:DUF2213 domain-containing protein [Peptococcaceae bacterium]